MLELHRVGLLLLVLGRPVRQQGPVHKLSLVSSYLVPLHVLDCVDIVLALCWFKPDHLGNLDRFLGLKRSALLVDHPLYRVPLASDGG